MCVCLGEKGDILGKGNTVNYGAAENYIENFTNIISVENLHPLWNLHF